MPRYFFHRTDGYVEHDTDGVELQNLSAARAQAVIFAGESLQGDPERVWSGQELRIEVTDTSGTLLLTVVTQAIDSPALTRHLKS